MVINLNDDPYLTDDDAKWIVTDYNRGSYEGDGIAYAELNDGKFYSLNLGHCSCYGAGERSTWELIGDITDLRTHVMGNAPLVKAIRGFRDDL